MNSLKFRKHVPNWRHAGALLLLPCVLLFAALSLAGCQHPAPLPLRLTSISGHMPDLKFSLTNDHDQGVTASDYLGKVVLLYFGYTHCPDVCPLTLANLHAVMQRLGPLASGAQILFVSVDPSRDTPKILHSYVTAFDPHIVGLTGSPRAIERLTKDYRAAFSREPSQANGEYEVTHSAGIYIFDRQGKA
ncbi:MAG: SCO family protein, partial [Rhodanobacter sp.]